MDYYLINIDSIEQGDTKIYFTSSKESSYVDFEENQLIKWNTLTLEWYRNTVIEKDKRRGLFGICNMIIVFIACLLIVWI